MATIADHRSCNRPAPTNGFWAMLRQMSGLTRQRRALRDLDDRLLDDIGLTRYEAQTESDKAVWEVPATWRNPR